MAALSYGGRVLEGFSAPARHAVAMATAEARRMHHERVGTEHLLLGLLAADGTSTAELLREAGANLPAARHKVAEVSGPGPDRVPADDPGLTPRAQRALDRAGRFSRQDRAASVGTDHVLRGVLDVEGLASQVLRGLDVDLGRLQDALVPPDGHADAGEPAPEPEPVAAPRPLRPHCPACGASLDDTLAATPIPARRESGAVTTVGVVYCGACGTAIGVVPARP